jgi:hypothetical protein
MYGPTEGKCGRIHTTVCGSRKQLGCKRTLHGGLEEMKSITKALKPIV